MKKNIFRGIGTALVTPFKDNKIDYSALERLIEIQINAGINALIIGGTTGESATLSDTERYELFAFTNRFIGGRTKLIFGTGTNDTAAAIRHTKKAERIGCDGILAVTPYYNKGTAEGLVKHYEQIAESTDLPIILYNVPSRTGVNLPVSTVDRLAKKENIVGIKEASDSHDRLIALSALSNEIKLYAGNDSALYTVLALGGEGVISVISNIYPDRSLDICKLYFSNSTKKALEKQQKLLPVINSLFLDTNPAPIKYIMSKMGLCSEEMRLPLYPVNAEMRKMIDSAFLSFEQEEERA